MLEQLINITSTEPYKSYGGMRTKEILISPWSASKAKLIFEIWVDEREEAQPPEIWELVCNEFLHTKQIPYTVVPGMQLKLYNNQPVLWGLQSETYYTVTGRVNDIPALMGELFIAHRKACGNWVDFNWYYSGILTVLHGSKKGQLAVPTQLSDSCFEIL
jgi:hypothetical protein